MTTYYYDRGVAPGDTRNVWELIEGRPTTLEQIREELTGGPEPIYSTAAELYRKPGTKAGIVDRVPILERLAIAAGLAPANPAVPIGNILPANEAQAVLPSWSPILHRFWNQLTPPVEFNLEHAGPTAGFPLVARPPVLKQAASATGIPQNALKWIGIGFIVLAAGLAMRK